MEGKRCLLNHYKRTPEAEAARKRLNQHSVSPSKKRKGRQSHSKDDEDRSISMLRNQLQQEENEMVFKTDNEIKPRSRAMGGVWLNTSDFPHSF
jgi:hypothetical protein